MNDRRVPEAAKVSPRGNRFLGLDPRWRMHLWFVGCTVVACVLFGTILTQGTWALGEAEPLGDFYDHQAASLLQGRLDVPLEAVQFEAFVRDGKTYGYFGLTPALLRLPWVALDLGFGRWSRVMMLGEFAAALGAGYLLLCEAVRRRSGRGEPPPMAVVLFVGNAGLGSTLLFLGSRAYVYHEAILCGAALALGSVWAALRYLDAPRASWWSTALVAGVLSVHARPSIGLFALTVLALSAGAVAWRVWREKTTGDAWRRQVRQSVMVAGLAGLGVASFNAVSYLKFRTIEGCPLRMNVQYDAERLAKIDGRQFHAGNLPFGGSAYLLRPDAVLSKYFPYVRLTEAEPAKFPSAKIDLVEPMLGLPYAMPGLVLAALFGLVAGVGAGGRAREVVGVLWLGILPMALSMFAAIAVSHRYTADFVPFLVAAAALGFAAIEGATGRRRIGALAVLGVATLVAVPLTVALTLNAQGEMVWLVPDTVRQRYCGLREDVDRFFGVRNPAGYEASALPIRNTDAKFLLWTAAQLESDPAKHPRVIAICEQLTRLMPNHAVVQAKVAGLLVACGRTKEGVAAYEHALRLDPSLATAHSNLGVAYAEMGRVSEAIREFEAALRLEPGHPQARESLQLLKAGRP